MSKDPDEPIEAEYEIVSDGGNSSSRKEGKVPSRRLKPVEVWKVKLMVWGAIALGVVILGLLLFFFAALFIYFFIPLMVIFIIWTVLKNLFR